MSRTPRQSSSDYEDYWTEFHDIEQNKDGAEVEEEDHGSKTPDGKGTKESITTCVVLVPE